MNTMRADLILLCSCVLIGYGDTFQIANFLSSFSGEAAHQRQLSPPYTDSSYPAQLTERQAGLGGDQIAERQSIVVGSITTIFVVFMISLITSIVTNIMFSIESIIPNNEEEPWEWCYDDPSCNEEAWKSQAEFMCNGIRNSPINIDFDTSSGMWTEQQEASAFNSPLKFKGYASVKYTDVRNTVEHIGSNSENGRDNKLSNKGGHTAQIDVVFPPPAGVGELSGGPLEVPYQILQLHFHWGSDSSPGSEHTYGGVQFPLEMHIVHVKSGLQEPLKDFPNYIDGLAVTGFMFNIGATNPAIEPIISALSSITGYDDSTPFTNFDLNALISPAIGGRYATYEGGLTTPTCNEVVRWINMESPLEISEEQLAAFGTLLDKNGNSIVNNFRSPQDLGGRTVRVINP